MSYSSYNGQTISYDDSGNPLNWYNGKKTFSGLTWEQGRQLTSITTGGKTTTYAYDADGIRTEKVVGGVTHHYVTRGGRLMRESFLSGSTEIIMDFSYDDSGRSCCNSGSVVACAARSSIALLLLLAVMESHYEPKHDPRSIRKRLRTLRGFLPPIPIWLLEAISVHISRLGNSFLATRNIRFALFTARMLKGHSYSGHHRLGQLQKAAALEKE